MKILVTGCTGFIGSHLVRRLEEEGHSVWAIVRASSIEEKLPGENVQTYTITNDIQDLIAFMDRERFDGVIHLASLFLASHKPEDIKDLIESNILFSTTVLEAAVKTEIPWFINTGTFWQHYESKEYSPVNLYAATKQAFEAIAAYYLETSPINFVTLKLSDTFGPGDTRPKIFNLWSKISKSGETLEMSPGEQLIDTSYIDNVIDGFLRLTELLAGESASSIRGRSFALRSNERMSLRELAGVFEEVFGVKMNIDWGKKEYRLREVMIPWETGEAIPGWQPRVSLREGIKKTIRDKE